MGDVTLTWVHRNRLVQVQREVVHQDAGNESAGPEGNYKVEVLIAGGVARTETGLTGTSYVYTIANRIADDADLDKWTQFRITPVNGTLEGNMRTTDQFKMSES